MLVYAFKSDGVMLSLFAQLEAVRPELASNKEDLNQLIGTGKRFTGLLRKVPEENLQSENITAEMDNIVDQWLNVSVYNV